MDDWAPRRIVVGIDGSDAATRATRVAAALARARDAELTIVTVIRPPEGWWGIVGSPPPAEALGDSLSAAQRDVLDATVAAVDLEGVRYETQEEIGDPSGALVQLCESMPADVLVVGRRGAGLLKRVGLGSVVSHLLHDSPCPVLVVP